MLGKKGIELSLTVVVVAVVLLTTAVVLIAVFSGLIGKESKQAHGLIADYDEDGILDLSDKCPCEMGVQEYAGCNSESSLDAYEAAADKAELRKCLKG